ncbi:unnamed protein product [Adineta steineri]|uniref:J domain-containing protein n=1 Tax=Adineta steineri TaxID=433720 RepID=A0A818UXE6_9BILA|nr:unnamed protein product [Adineta steineri]CAF3704138.1 unnamed protein product [Adineta steineri]
MASNSHRKQSSKTNEDYYDILGVNQRATDEEIKQAYRKLALRLHPDKNSDPQATAQFQVVAKAYKVLGNPRSRATYDLLGSQAAGMIDQYDDYPETLRELSTCKKVLYGFIFVLTGCCFGFGCGCLCCCCCCCGFCCNNCCGKYKNTTVSNESEADATTDNRSQQKGSFRQQPTNTNINSDKF